MVARGGRRGGGSRECKLHQFHWASQAIRKAEEENVEEETLAIEQMRLHGELSTLLGLLFCYFHTVCLVTIQIRVVLLTG